MVFTLASSILKLVAIDDSVCGLVSHQEIHLRLITPIRLNEICVRLNFSLGWFVSASHEWWLKKMKWMMMVNSFGESIIIHINGESGLSGGWTTFSSFIVLVCFELSVCETCSEFYFNWTSWRKCKLRLGFVKLYSDRTRSEEINTNLSYEMRIQGS